MMILAPPRNFNIVLITHFVLHVLSNEVYTAICAFTMPLYKIVRFTLPNIRHYASRYVTYIRHYTLLPFMLSFVTPRFGECPICGTILFYRGLCYFVVLLSFFNV